ncbi:MULTISPECIES: hypothetical protein [Cryobacterium]|uniref:Uncharacterized protein n=1 Tax=Cryobacterium breve TaxID=1259258 RepID=A0ABY2J100_9MICO|nr:MULTISPECIES: hypothetical protein [Cryobacterium]TFC96845.1 hypothetical protein E3T20_02270 [Cryobacterium sp. TmT3-12]TFC97359.1 hypothetical protein E3O65_11235 [Cryobacterium breve]
MKRIFHPGGSIVTGDELADAVMHYAEALTRRSQVDVVDFPILGEFGTLDRAQILIGAPGGLTCVGAESSYPDLLEADTVDTFRHKALAGTASGRASWTGDGLDSPQFDEFDY